MDTPPAYTELADKAGISRSYANEIVNGREPKRPLAIHIFRATGWRHSSIASLSDDQLAVFEAVEPWTRRPSEQSSAAAL